MSLGVSKPKPCTKQRVPNHVSKLCRPKLDFHTPVIYMHILIVPYNPRHVSIHVIFFFFLSSLFSLIRVCSPFLQDQNEIFILVLSLFDIIPFLFQFGPPTLLIFHFGPPTLLIFHFGPPTLLIFANQFMIFLQ